MAKYRRFVAYVYEYQKGRKGRNCGFIRVEAWEERCRMEVHLLCPGLLPDVLCEVLGFVRNAGLMDGRLIGTCRTKENRADCVIETGRNSLGGSGVSLDALGGMILTTENGGFFGTEWDDQPVRPENFRRVEPEKETDAMEREREEHSQDHKKAEQSETGENSEKDSRDDTEKEPEERKEQFSEKAGESQSKEKEIEKEGPEDWRQKIQTEETEKGQRKEQKEGQKEEGKEMRTEEVPAEEEAEGTAQPEGEEIGFGEIWDPFGDGEILDCRKIQPGDFMYFHPRDCALRNNRFLQYGFYSFGHLLVGKLKTGGYILGVPGGYDQQERFMANVFGFPYFKRSGQIRLPQNKGGYWYRLINPPKLH